MGLGINPSNPEGKGVQKGQDVCERQALIYPLFYVLLATKDIARLVRPRVSK